MLKNLLALIIGVVFSLIIFEILLNLYNPFEAVVTKGNTIVLRANSHTIYNNTVNEKLPKEIIYSTNSLGMRGPELSSKYDLKIITVGGSTTHSIYNSDNDTWPHLVMLELNKIFSKKIWLNNAGISGHSTFGHTILVNDYLLDLKPDIIIFLVGINDIGRTDINADFFGLYNKSNTSILSKLKNILYNFEIVEALVTISRNVKAKKLNLKHEINFDLKTLDFATDSEINDNSYLDKEKQSLSNYRERLKNLIEVVKSNNILPVLVTQSSLYGDSFDPVTGVDLSKIIISGVPGLHRYKLLQLYNYSTIEIAKNLNIPFIDLGNEIERNSEYYWDSIHYSIKGNKKVSDIISKALKDIIIERDLL